MRKYNKRGAHDAFCGQQALMSMLFLFINWVIPVCYLEIADSQKVWSLENLSEKIEKLTCAKTCWFQNNIRHFLDGNTKNWPRYLLFFAVYVIYKKNYSFSRVVFFHTKIANSFSSKINDSGRLRTTRFSSSKFGVRVSVVSNILTIYPEHFLIP